MTNLLGKMHDLQIIGRQKMRKLAKKLDITLQKKKDINNNKTKNMSSLKLCMQLDKFSRKVEKKSKLAVATDPAFLNKHT